MSSLVMGILLFFGEDLHGVVVVSVARMVVLVTWCMFGFL